MKRKTRVEYVLDIRPEIRNCVNVKAAVIAPLYQYYRLRIGCPRWPESDEQRYQFEKIIINMCRVGDIKVPSWTLTCSKINAFYARKWWELRGTVIFDNNCNGILYEDIREELKLINKILQARRFGATYIMQSKDTEVLMRIFETDERIGEGLSEAIEKRVNA